MGRMMMEIRKEMIERGSRIKIEEEEIMVERVS